MCGGEAQQAVYEALIRNATDFAVLDGVSPHQAKATVLRHPVDGSGVLVFVSRGMSPAEVGAHLCGECGQSLERVWSSIKP